jgi:hypothetical protein
MIVLATLDMIFSSMVLYLARRSALRRVDHYDL